MAYLFAKMLRVNRGLRRLHLGKLRMRDEGAQLLAHYLQENDTLVELSLRWCVIGDAAQQARCHLPPAVAHNPRSRATPGH